MQARREECFKKEAVDNWWCCYERRNRDFTIAFWWCASLWPSKPSSSCLSSIASRPLKFYFVSVFLNLFSCAFSYLLFHAPPPWMLLGFKLRALHLLQMCSTTWAMPPALFTLVYFSGKGFALLPPVALDLSPLIFAWHVSRIIGMSDQV
jgi:hypothetical protein